MADDKKKKKEKKKGSGIGTVFMIGLIIGLLGGICLGWLIEPPAAFTGAIGEAKAGAAQTAKDAANKVRGGTADALESGADPVRPEDEK